MSDKERFRRFTALITGMTLARWRQILTLDASSAVSLIATVQLALRHPGNQGQTAHVMRQLCDQLIASMDEAAPGIGVILQAGYDPSQDVT